ncbi:MAG: GDSL-type esterase/lipase family protein [Bacteroidota bacterium]
MASENTPPLQQRLGKAFGNWGLILTVGLVPPVFNYALAVSPLLPWERGPLWVFCGLFALVALVVRWFGKHWQPGVLLLYFSGLCLVTLEFGWRMSVNAFASEHTLSKLSLYGNRTYPEFTAYSGHPFTCFTGTPSRSLEGNNALGNLSMFNKYGFVGPDWTYDKPEGVLRVAALGGSTTASGYPAKLAEFLGRSDSGTYEVMNFGHPYWNSANTTVNFLLNVVAFDPDVIIIHQGWNDGHMRNVPPGQFRADYSHALKAFEHPFMIDRYPLRVSLVYRHVKRMLVGNPTWFSLEEAVYVQGREHTEHFWQNMDELQPFERNIRTIISHALHRGIQVILTTQPHSTDPNISYAYTAKHIDQTNAIMRQLAEDYATGIGFVDLDSLMTGTMDSIFKDLGHMNDFGIRFKAEQIGAGLLEYRQPADSTAISP